MSWLRPLFGVGHVRRRSSVASLIASLLCEPDGARHLRNGSWTATPDSNPGLSDLRRRTNHIELGPVRAAGSNPGCANREVEKFSDELEPMPQDLATRPQPGTTPRSVRLFYLSQTRGVGRSNLTPGLKSVLRAKPGQAEALRPFGGGQSDVTDKVSSSSTPGHRPRL